MDDDDDLGPSGTLVIEPEDRSDHGASRNEHASPDRLVPVPMAPRIPSERPLPPPPIFQLVAKGLPRPSADAPNESPPRVGLSNHTQVMEVQPELEAHELDWGEEPRTHVKPEEEEIKTLLKEPPPPIPDAFLETMPASQPISTSYDHTPSPGPNEYGSSPSSHSIEAMLPGGPAPPQAPYPPNAGYPEAGYPAPAAPPPAIRGWMLLAFGGALGLVFSIAAVIIALRQGPAESAASATARASASPSSTVANAPTEAHAPTTAGHDTAAPSASAVTVAPSATASATSSATSSPSDGLPDADKKAIAALEQLRDGIAACVKDTIKVLPGASKPVPDSMAWFKHGPYSSLKRDWISPFFSCTRFKMEEPMPFMIQWQVDKPNKQGTGVAWVPDNAGNVGRVYGFTGKLVGKTVEFGPIGPLPPTRKIQRN